MARPRRTPSLAAPDAFDLAILRIVQKDNLTSQRSIGDQVNLSAPAVQRRLRRMEAEGVIRANAAVVDGSRVGMGLTIVVLVQVESETVQLIDLAKRSFIESPEVQQCYYVTGATDFVLILALADMQQYEDVARRLFLANPNVKRFETLVVMDQVKASLEVSLPDAVA